MEHVKIESVQAKVIENNIAYIKLKQFQERTSVQLKNALSQLQSQNVKALVLDIRNNPGGVLTACVEVAELFVAPNSLIVSLIGKDGRKDDYSSRSKRFVAQMPIVILVNRGSASGSEIFAGAMQDYGIAQLVGTPTFGNGSIQTIIPLREGAGLRLTTSRAYTPKGRSIGPESIQPDILIHEEDGGDPALSTALAELRARL